MSGSRSHVLLKGTMERHRLHGEQAHLVDAEVLADVHYPATQTPCSCRLHSDGFRCEVGLLDVVFFHLVDTSLWDVVLVKTQEALQEGIYIAHVLLAGCPADVLHTKC